MTHITPPKSLVDRFLKAANKSLIANTISPNGESMLIFFRSIPTLSATANEEECHITKHVTQFIKDHGGIVDDGKESVEDIVNDVKKMILESRPPCKLTDILLEMWFLAPISNNNEYPVYLER